MHRRGVGEQVRGPKRVEARDDLLNGSVTGNARLRPSCGEPANVRVRIAVGCVACAAATNARRIGASRPAACRASQSGARSRDRGTPHTPPKSQTKTPRLPLDPPVVTTW